MEAVVRTGVMLAPPEDLGGWLADAVAFEAAGADALWIDSGELFDPYPLTAALAALTVRALLVSPLAGGAGDTADPPARTLATLSALSHGRAAYVASPGQLAELPPDVTVFQPAADGEYEQAARGADLRTAGGVGGEGDPARAAAGRWVPVPSPQSRADWRTSLRDAAEQGVHGLLVPAGPRLLDILRNPDDPGGRQDLHLVQG